MPLKDHKREIWCVQVIAGMLKEEATKRQDKIDLEELQKEIAEQQDLLAELSGSVFGQF